jgi:CBS domain-containing protein
MLVRSIREVLADRTFQSIAPDATLEDACDLLSRTGADALIVLRDGSYQGVITERDIIRHVSQRGGFATAHVEAAMQTGIPTVDTRSCIVDAIARMRACGRRTLPVLDTGGTVVGLLSMQDIPAEYRQMYDRYTAWNDAGTAA